MGFLEITGLRKSFGTSYAVRDFDLDVGQGEFISFLGPSGCGKTTTLRMVAGFESPTGGDIRIGGKSVVRLKPSQRNIGMVFQSYALFPNLTVEQNVAFGLKVKGRPKPEIVSIVGEMLELVGLNHLAARYPFQLSGGQQQRVALARALAIRPAILLLDEPLSALDAKIRVSLRTEIRAIQQRLGITTIYVTHDQEEALSMSDRIVVMDQGSVEQIGNPFEIYNTPANRFVASFVGTLNVLEARVTDPAKGVLALGAQSITLGRTLAHNVGESITIAMRPESISLASDASEPDTLQGKIESVHFLGSVVRINARLEDQLIRIDSFNRHADAMRKVGDKVAIRVIGADILEV